MGTMKPTLEHPKYCWPVILLIAFVAVFSGCAINPVSGQRELVLMSEQQEMAIGRQNHQEVLKIYGRYENPALQQFIQGLGEKLAVQSHRPELFYRFTLLDSPEINAFALPGGYIYITRGMLAYLNSEAELAAILGHEIGHVTARHGARQQTASTLAGLGVTLGQVLVPELRGQTAQQLTNVLGTAILRGYGRDHELQADGLAAEYLAKAGHDPRAILEVLKILQNQANFDQQIAKAEGRQPRAYHGLFSTHPDSDTRLQAVVAKANYLSSVKDLTKVDEPFLKRLDGLVYGDSPSQGIRRNNRFYHLEMGFALTFPSNWQLKNLPDRVLALAPGGNSWIDLQAQDLNKRISPLEFMQQQLGIKRLSAGESINPHGLEGYTGIAPLNTSKGVVPARVAVIYFDQRAYIFSGFVSGDEEAQPNAKVLINTIMSFHPIEESERELAQPLRIHISRPSGSFATLANKSNIPGYAESTLRLLNHYYPEGEAQAGALLKTVR